MDIHISEIDQIIERQVVNGIAICTTTQVRVCSPATITFDQVTDIVDAAVLKPDNSHTSYFIDGDHPLLGYQVADTIEHLYDDCANYLYDQGFSVIHPNTHVWEY